MIHFEKCLRVGFAHVLPIVLALVCFMPSPAAAQSHSHPLAQLSLEQIEAQIEAGELGKIRALSAEQNGETVYRKRFGKGELGDRVDIKSAGKSITALAVGAAIADRKLAGVEVKVWPFLGSPREGPHGAITIGDLLSMSSALDCNDWERRSPGQEEKMYRTRIWRDFALGLPARDYTRDADGDGPFSYCTAGVFLLGQVVEKAVGERFDLYVQRRLFDPLGIDGADWRRSRSGEVQSGGQLTISDTALLKIGRMVLDMGTWEGEQIVPREWIKSMLTPHHQLGEQVYYGRLWWAMPLRSSRGFEAAWMMKGNGGNIVAVVPNMDAVLVVQTENYNKSNAERRAFMALTALLKSLPIPEEE